MLNDVMKIKPDKTPTMANDIWSTWSIMLR
jgi:hypothetical protein